MRNKAKINLLVLMLFSPLIFSQTTLKQYYQYEIEGTIINNNSTRLENIPVIIMGKLKTSTEWIALNKFADLNADLPDFPIALSDDKGHFWVRITPQFDKLDSIVPALVINDSTYELGTPISLVGVEGTPVKSRYSYSNESGCSCENTTSSELQISGYTYSFKKLEITTKLF